MLLNEKYKILHLVIDGEMWKLPTINNSYHYTIWVLKHKYKEVILYGVIPMPYSEVIEKEISFTEPTSFTKGKIIPVNSPNINPLVEVSSIKSIVAGLGVDAVLLLMGEVFTDITREIKKDITIIQYSACSSFFDNFIVHSQIKSKKTQGIAPKLDGMPFYKYTSKTRRAFNRKAELIRKLLKKESNIERNSKVAHVTCCLTNAERDYYESQLHSFVYTYIYKGKTQYGKQ